MISLDRPLVVLDLETTGLDPEDDQVIQIALMKYKEGPLLQQEPSFYYSQLVNPSAEIADEVLELTGLDREDIEEAPPFEAVVDEITGIIEGADLAGFNIENFDIEFLENEIARAGEEMPPPANRKILDVLRLEKVLSKRNLEALYEKYTGEELEDSHDARADVIGTTEVLAGQIATHSVEAESLSDLISVSHGDYLDPEHQLRELDGGSIAIDFGKKHRKKTIEQVLRKDPQWLKWAIENIDNLREIIIDRLVELAGPCCDPDLGGRLNYYEDGTWGMVCAGRCGFATSRYDNPVDAVVQWRSNKEIEEANAK